VDSVQSARERGNGVSGCETVAHHRLPAVADAPPSHHVGALTGGSPLSAPPSSDDASPGFAFSCLRWRHSIAPAPVRVGHCAFVCRIPCNTRIQKISSLWSAFVKRLRSFCRSDPRLSMCISVQEFELTCLFLGFQLFFGACCDCWVFWLWHRLNHETL
jgi:hypothetical protein